MTIEQVIGLLFMPILGLILGFAMLWLNSRGDRHHRSSGGRTSPDNVRAPSP